MNLGNLQNSPIFALSARGTDEVAAADPISATEVGVSAFDDRWTDYSPDAYTERRDLARRLAGEGFGVAEMNLMNTFSLDMGGPVFNLPTDYTANSEDGYIVDNRFVVPGSGGEASLPAPATTALLALGLLGVVWRRRAH